MSSNPANPVRISAIVPARNEEEVIADCLESLARQEAISEILVVNDQSTDRTGEIVKGLMRVHPKIQLLEAPELPAGWVGKNHAVWIGAQRAIGDWLLFTDADAVHEADSAARALEIAKSQNAELVSFSPEQSMATWYEKALIPYVYCRLSSSFSYDRVNDPACADAAANGQFIFVCAEAYHAMGGHVAVAGDVLEDVALAEGFKEAGRRIWFGSGTGIVRVRMYRSFGGMWQGWRKNLYRLMGGTAQAAAAEIARAVFPVLALFMAMVTVAGLTESVAYTLSVFAAGSFVLLVAYDRELRRNQFADSLVWYGIPGRLLFAAVLLASYRGHQTGRLKWKGREYPVGTPGASNR